MPSDGVGEFDRFAGEVEIQRGVRVPEEVDCLGRVALEQLGEAVDQASFVEGGSDSADGDGADRRLRTKQAL